MSVKSNQLMAGNLLKRIIVLLAKIMENRNLTLGSKASSNQNGQAFLAQQEVKLLLFVS